ncbi:MAG: addiction module protein [Weeksellaceae bacterium]|mgnify:CR=1 FL=1|jgi:putative addiction module component (TIGR02574 family)|nr:addiction module protein [Weeksellaceae bacterium]
MNSIDFSKYTDAEKIRLAEQLWDSVFKEDIEISAKIESIMMERLQRIEEGRAVFYSREQVQERIQQLRKELDE